MIEEVKEIYPTLLIKNKKEATFEEIKYEIGEKTVHQSEALALASGDIKKKIGFTPSMMQV